MRKIFLYATLFLLVSSATTPAFAAFPLVNPAEQANASEESSPNAVSAKDAMKQFKQLSKKERRERFKAVRSELKKFKQEKRAGNEPSTNTLLLVILAILLPPLAVYLHEGETNNRFWLSLILTLLFWIPGVIYALIVVLGE